MVAADRANPRVLLRGVPDLEGTAAPAGSGGVDRRGSDRMHGADGRERRSDRSRGRAGWQGSGAADVKYLRSRHLNTLERIWVFAGAAGAIFLAIKDVIS